MSIKFTIDKENLVATIQGATDRLMTAIALQTEAHAKDNIVANDQIDTGFMLNSVYTLTPEQGSSYGRTWASGKYQSKKSGRTIEQERAPETALEAEALAAVAAGANYAIYQELQNSFLYRALEQVQGDVDALGDEARRELGL